ncbi:MAG: universal stress protein UspA [Acidimicrobiaceae bacterium]|jgi:nucleotide-binding universal stress UspA family protein|nr:universal stress protein UspA [Acidimicrobiaceae bacterium]
MDRPSQPADRPITSPGAPATTTVVVVGIDGSETSWDAFWWACGEARRLSGRAVAVFVSPTAGSSMVAASAVIAGAPFDYDAIDQVAIDRAEQLRSEVEALALAHEVKLTFVHARGETSKELLRVAVAHHADLIVVGRSMQARHHLIGSLGRRLICERDAPVVVVVP